MPEEPLKRDIKEIQEEVADLVQRALVQTADLQDVEEKLRDLSEKVSKSIPLPENDAPPSR